MDKEKPIGRLIKVSYALIITCMIGRWGICMAYMQRGYKAVGGEYILIMITYLVAWKAMHYFMNTLEESKHERKDKKRRGGRAAGM